MYRLQSRLLPPKLFRFRSKFKSSRVHGPHSLRTQTRDNLVESFPLHACFLLLLTGSEASGYWVSSSSLYRPYGYALRSCFVSCPGANDLTWMCARALIPTSLLIGALNLASETAQTRDLQTFPFGYINLRLPSLTPPTIDLATRRDADVSFLHSHDHSIDPSEADRGLQSVYSYCRPGGHGVGKLGDRS